jgi:hypothetical protein
LVISFAPATSDTSVANSITATIILSPLLSHVVASIRTRRHLNSSPASKSTSGSMHNILRTLASHPQSSARNTHMLSPCGWFANSALDAAATARLRKLALLALYMPSDVVPAKRCTAMHTDQRLANSAPTAARPA